MHILFLSDNFPPEVNAPASRTFEHCREWVKAGHRVTVITCAPNFPKGIVYPGYRNRLWQRECMDSVEVIRVWTYITANEGFFKRIMDYVSFMFSATLAALWVKRVDLVIGTSPQFFTAVAAYAVSACKRIPFVFEVRDLWPEFIVAVGAMQNAKLVAALETLADFLYRRAAHIITVTDAFRRVLMARGLAGQKIAVITNGADLSRFQPQSKDTELELALGLRGKFVVGYVGTHGMAHGLETLLRTADRLRTCPDIVFLLLGDGACKQALLSQAAAMGLSNVVFLDSVPKAEVTRYWSLLDVSLVHLKKTALFDTVIPSKLFEGMAMGIPVLHGVAGESAELVQREGAGLCFPAEDDAALAEGVLALQAKPALRQRLSEQAVAAAQRYQRDALARQMLAVLESLNNADGKSGLA